MMSGKMPGRGEGVSNAWSRGRPVMSSFESSSSSNSSSMNRGPPPGMSRGRGYNGNSSNNSNNNNNNSGKYGGRDYSNFNNGGNNNNSARYGSAPSSGNSVQSTHSATNDASNNPALFNRERYLHLLLTMVGHTVAITKTNGDVVEGIFHTFCPFEKQREQVKNVYVIKGCRMVKRGNGNAAAAAGGGEFQEGSTVLISSSHVARLHIKSLRLDNRPNNNNQEGDMFRTDAEISGQRGGTERLVAAGSVWTTGGDGGGLGDGGSAMGGLESGVATIGLGGRGGMFKSGGTAAAAGGGGGGMGSNANNWRTDKVPTNSSLQGLQGTIGDWDQFSANEKRFNVKATFDENLYTTALDYNNIDSNQVAEAERIAKEIESTASTNIHIMEERNQKISADYDEEDLYSGVLKKKDDCKEDGGSLGAKVPVVAEKKMMNYAAAAGAMKKTTVAPVTDAPAASSVSAKQDAVQAQSSESNSPTSESADSPVEEKKGKPEDAQSEKAENQKEEEKDAKSEEGKEPPKPKLNPNAKEFTFNPAAKTFTPSFATTAPAPVAATPVVPEAVPSHNPMEYHGGAAGTMHPMMAAGNYGMGGMQYMQHGGPGMMPIMNAPHPQMRHPYTPYGGGPGQPMQPPQQPVPVHEDSSSVATGEGSSVPSDLQQHPQQHQYMPGYIPPGPYPGYYGGAAAMLHHHPHQRPGFHPPPQMQVMPGAAYQRMYPGMMQPMRGPPPYGYGPGGAPVPYPNAGLYPGLSGEEGHKFTRKNSKGGGNGGGYKNKQRNSYTGRGGGNGNGGRGGYQGNYSEGRQSDDGSPTNQEGDALEQQSEGSENATAPVEDMVT